jgi:hypothetical protein
MIKPRVGTAAENTCIGAEIEFMTNYLHQLCLEPPREWSNKSRDAAEENDCLLSG